MYGPHLTLDLQGCNSSCCDDLSLVYDLLESLPIKIGMKRMTRPYVFPCVSGPQKDVGITGVVIIEESHISIHTYTKQQFVFADIFSCKPFDVRIATECVVETFKAQSYEKNLIERGREFPK